MPIINDVFVKLLVIVNSNTFEFDPKGDVYIQYNIPLIYMI